MRKISKANPYLLILLLISISCTKEDIQSNNFTVKGTIVSDNIPVEGANVTIDGIQNWTTVTSAEGSFQIDNIPKGEHLLNVDKGDKSSSFIEKEYSIYVDENNTDLENLKIPKPVILNEPNNVDFSNLDLSWNKTDATEFYEYKLFRHNSQGLDEDTGELIYVSTNPDDTVFSDSDLISSTEYYYRVFVKNEYSQLGGSNIVGTKTLAGNLIPNGDFEDLGTFESNWSLNTTQGTLITAIVDSVFKEGGGSLYNKNDSAYVNGNINTYTDLLLKNPITIGVNKNYEISGWIRAYGQQGDMGSVWIVVKQGNEYISTLDLGVQANGTGGDWGIDDTGWVFKSKTFYVTKNEPISIHIYMPIEHVWIDELKIMPQE